MHLDRMNVAETVFLFKRPPEFAAIATIGAGAWAVAA
jgi:hypothetical protein